MLFRIVNIVCKFILVFSTCIEKEDFDYIIVGAGSSGAIIASRLSEDPNMSVLLLEAGEKPLPISDIPLPISDIQFLSLASLTSLTSEMTWTLKTERQLIKSNSELTPGKVLGGSGRINAVLWTRGNKHDFDLWLQLSNPGWDYKHVLPYFRKMENYTIPLLSPEDATHHGFDGPVTISAPQVRTPALDVFFEAATELNQTVHNDYNGKTQSGFSAAQFNIKNGVRCDSYNCYLKPAMVRSNLHVLTSAFVTKILIDAEKRATGVDYVKDSSVCTAKANKEVIISAGSLNSPKLLMLSGIGPVETLNKFQILLFVDLPGVGQNLQNHIIAYETVNLNQSLSIYKTHYFNQWFETETGPVTFGPYQKGLGYIQSKGFSEIDWPDIEIIMKSINNLLPDFPKGSTPSGTRDDGKTNITLKVVLLRPKSRGYVTLRSNNSEDHPIINPKYLSHPDDIKTLSEGITFLRNLINTKAFQKYGAKFINNLNECQELLLHSDKQLECMLKGLLTHSCHFSGTCRMGPRSDSLAVVDHRLRVHKVKNLRVADASIMPNIVSAHTNAVSMMIGEKAADMIKEDNSK